VSSPADRLADGRGSLRDLAELDQARAATVEDLNRLLVGYAQAMRDLGPDRAHCAYVTGLLRDWDEVTMACALVEAVERLVRRLDEQGART
jgi:hypothetical protein